VWWRKQQRLRNGVGGEGDASDDDALLLALPAIELSRRIKARELRCEDLTRMCIDRLEAVNPLLNAVVATRFPEALEEARQVSEPWLARHLTLDVSKRVVHTHARTQKNACRRVLACSVSL
jgi:hypothetical protein